MTERGRDVSVELTEIRTVLSRAESAIQRISARDQDWMVRSGRQKIDQDRDDMLIALEAVVMKLNRWARTGRPIKSKGDS